MAAGRSECVRNRLSQHRNERVFMGVIEPFSDQDQAEIRLEYARLKQEHADFDAAISAMIAVGCDPLQIQRMKKKKLTLKDRLSQVEDRIIPDIIA